MDDQRYEDGGPSTERKYLTKQELVLRSGLSASTIQRYRRDLKIPFYQPGGPGAKLLFPPDAVEAARHQSRQEHEALKSPAGSVSAGRDPAAPPKFPGPRPRWQTSQPKRQQR